MTDLPHLPNRIQSSSEGSPDTEPTETSQTARNPALNLKYPRHVPLPSSIGKTNSGQSGQAARSDMSLLPNAPAGSAQLRRLEKQQYPQVHRQFLRQRLQHRIEVAKAQGDRELLTQLEQEMQALD